MSKLSFHITCFFVIGRFFMSENLSSEVPRLPVDEDRSIQENFLNLAKQSDAVIFTPPSGWHLADPKSLPPSVKVMVVGKGEREFPPSINLGTEKYSGTLKQYLKRIKEINDSQGAVWKDLGKIRTQAGEASLSQVDTQTQWGNVRMMHAILKKEDMVYILTAASLKEEFPKHYKYFFNSLRSLRFNAGERK
jgi:hypothetical protein